MFKGIAILFFSAFAIVANAADSAAIGGPPGLSPAYATEGTGCVGVGTQAINTAGLPLSCQSGVWEKTFKLEQPRVVYGTFGNLNGDVGVAYCAADEIVLGGGADCSDPTFGYIHTSSPIENPGIQGWIANCFSIPGYPDPPARAFAICSKKQ